MPRIPTGSWPTGRLSRNVTLAEFDNLHAAPHGASEYPLAPAASITGNNWDVLTPLYRGRSDFTGGGILEAQGWTRGLGTPGGAVGPATEFRVGAVWLDIAIWNTRSVSLLVEWVFWWGAPASPRVGGSYRILPVKGNAAPSLDLVAVAHFIQGIRIPTGWFRWSLTNEDVLDIAEGDVLMHMWLRGD